MKISNVLITSLAILAFTVGCAGKSSKKHGGGGANDVLTTGEGDSTVDAGEENPGMDPVLTFEPDVGIKTGHQIYNSYMAVTAIPESTATVAQFTTLEASLPLANRIVTFDAGKQSSIVKLAAYFCNTAVKTTLIPGYVAPTTDAQRSVVSKALMDKFWGAGIDNGMNATEQEAVLNKLQADLVAGGATPDNAAVGACISVASSLPTILL